VVFFSKSRVRSRRRRTRDFVPVVLYIFSCEPTRGRRTRENMKQLYVVTILVIVLAFLLGVLMGSFYRTKSLDEATRFLKDSELATESYLLEQQLLEGLDVNCDLAKARLNTLSQDLYRLGKVLGGPTSQQDLGETQYHLLKKKFHLLQIQTYVLLLKLRKQCHDESHVVLFYFAQQDPASLQQGHVLDKLVEAYNVRVFAVEYNYSSELRFLEEYYNVTQTPGLVVDYDKKYASLVEYQTLADQFS